MEDDHSSRMKEELMGRMAQLKALGDSRKMMESVRPIQLPTITSLPAMQPTGVQFLSIPLSGMTQPQNLLSQPLSSFLPQNFFTGAASAAAAASSTAGHPESPANSNDEG